MAKRNILLVERDDHTCDFIRSALTALDAEVIAEHSCRKAWQTIESQPVAMVVMGDGWDDCEDLALLRSMKSSVGTRYIPSIVLRQRESDADTVAALEAGADDVIDLPVSGAELAARVRTCLSRTAAQPRGSSLCVGDLVLDEDRFRILSGDRVIDVSPREFQLMEFLMRNSGHVHDRGRLLREVWSEQPEISPRTVDVHVRRLRAALERIGCDHYLQTVRGIGYRFSARIGENKIGASGDDELRAH